jgi:hypothetical protein
MAVAVTKTVAAMAAVDRNVANVVNVAVATSLFL